MEFGIHFIPDVGPEQKSARQYFDECLRLSTLAEGCGWDHVRAVEHYFIPYGGYSPNPIVFLAAIAARTDRMRLITAALLPVFNHPLKVAGEIGMLDAISGGRLDVGFARAFLPHEFARFGRSLDESRARFDEGMAQVLLLLEQENVSAEGRYHSFHDTTSLPRPTQRPRPPVWVAAIASPASFIAAAAVGHGIMAIPFGAARMRKLADYYRATWRQAGHAGRGRIMLSFYMVCHESRERAWAIAREPLNRHLRSIASAASDWTALSSQDYAGYAQIAEMLAQETIESQVESGGAWIGTPDDISDQIARYTDAVGGFDAASLQVNFNTIAYADAERSLRLFSEAVMPRFRRAS